MVHRRDSWSALCISNGHWDFFRHLFHSGLQISTIRGYRSAITIIHGGFEDGSNLSNNSAFSHLIRMFIERPPLKKLIPSWDLGSVLHKLARTPFEPAGCSTLHNLTIKTVFFLAAATTRRRSELHALTIESGHVGNWEASAWFPTCSSWPRTNLRSSPLQTFSFPA